MPRRTKAEIDVEATNQHLDTLMEGQNVLPTDGRGLIYGKLIDIMNDIDAIAKTVKKDAGVKYAFRGIDEMMNAIHPVLVKHRVVIVPYVIDVKNEMYENNNKKTIRSAVLTMGYRFIAEDGSGINASICAESVDFSDKATQQAASYCYKDLLQKTFCIPTADQSDGDDKQPDIQGASRLENLPKLADRPQINPSAPIVSVPPASAPPVVQQAQTEIAAQPDGMPDEAWASIRKELIQFNLDEQNLTWWIRKTLVANNLVVPDNLALLTKAAGTILWKVANYSNKSGELVNKMP